MAWVCVCGKLSAFERRVAMAYFCATLFVPLLLSAALFCVGYAVVAAILLAITVGFQFVPLKQLLPPDLCSIITRYMDESILLTKCDTKQE